MLANFKYFCLVSAAFVAVSGPNSVSAQETPWQNHDGKIQSRIVAAGVDKRTDEGDLFAWEAQLAPGWKTYWRSPGEAGLPVEMTTADGTPIDLGYPFPERFELFDIETLGYSKQVAIPFRVKLTGDEPVRLVGDFMICKDVCIPFRAKYDVDSKLVEGAGFLQQVKMDSWVADVPLRGTVTEGGLAITSVKVTGPAGRQKMIVDVRGDGRLEKADLLAECHEGSHFSKPSVHLMGDGTSARLVMDVLEARKPRDMKNMDVRLTFTDGQGNVIDRTVAVKAGRWSAQSVKTAQIAR